MFDKKTPVQKEWEAFLKREKKKLGRYGSPRESFWEKRLASLVPDGLSSKLEEAFCKAFQVTLPGRDRADRENLFQGKAGGRT